MSLTKSQLRTKRLMSCLSNARGSCVLPRKIRRFRSNEDGATAVEFAMIATPFFLLMFGIIQVSLMFFTQEMLDAGVNTSARMIRTGQAQINGMDEAALKTLICSKVASLSDCSTNLVLDVRSFPGFEDVDLPAPIGPDEEINTDVAFSPGSGSEVVIVRAFYAYKLPFATFSDDGPLSNLNLLSNMGGGRRLIASSAAFRNEPF